MNRTNKPTAQALEPLAHPTNGPGYCSEEMESSKIPPLDSPSKENRPHEHTHGVIGEDYCFQNTHLEPLPHGGMKMGPSQQGGVFCPSLVI
jgi:hypothetical protein